MENKAILVLKEQINKVQDEIVQDKVDIADLYLEVVHYPPMPECGLEAFLDRVESIDKMKPLVKKLDTNKIKLEALQNSKTEIEKAYATV